MESCTLDFHTPDTGIKHKDNKKGQKGQTKDMIQLNDVLLNRASYVRD